MQLIEKTKVYFSQPIFLDIGDEKELEEEKKLSDAIEIGHMRVSGYYEGSLVVMHTCKNKEIANNWGVISKMWEKWPEIGNKFVPIEVKWINGSGYGANRYHMADLFLIQEGPDDDVLKALAEYNEDTTDKYGSD